MTTRIPSEETAAPHDPRDDYLAEAQIDVETAVSLVTAVATEEARATGRPTVHCLGIGPDGLFGGDVALDEAVTLIRAAVSIIWLPGELKDPRMAGHDLEVLASRHLPGHGRELLFHRFKVTKTDLDNLSAPPGPTVRRSAGIPVTLYGQYARLVGSGYQGATEELDAAVAEAADALAAAYGMDVTIRFNSDRRSGGAFLTTHEPGRLGLGSDVGIGITAELAWERRDGRMVPTDDLYITVNIKGRCLRDPSMTNRQTEPDPRQGYLLAEMPDVPAAVAFCLQHTRRPPADTAIPAAQEER